MRSKYFSQDTTRFVCAFRAADEKIILLETIILHNFMQTTASGPQRGQVIGPTRQPPSLVKPRNSRFHQHQTLTSREPSRDSRPYPRHTMFSSARTRIASAALSAARPGRLAATRASYSVSASRFNNENTLRPNDPAAPRKPVPNVSATNATPVESMGDFDGRLAETPEAGERSRELQAPNRASTWAKGQAPREEAMTGPRFEQTIMGLQVSFFIVWVN